MRSSVAARPMWVTFCAALFLGTSGWAEGAWELPLFTADPKLVLEAANARHVAASADSAIVDLRGDFRVDRNGRVHSVNRTVVRILKPAGVRRFATLTVVWFSWRQNHPKVRSRVITPDGKPHLLDESTITEAGVPAQLVQGVFSDEKILNAPLPAVAEGCVVESEVETEDREVVFPGGRFLSFPLTNSVPIVSAGIRIEAPADQPLTVLTLGFQAARRQESRQGEWKRVVVEAENIPGVTPRQFLPPEAAPAPAVVVSTAETWQTVAAWYSEIVDRQAGISEVTGAPMGVVERTALIEATLAEIQHKVRYTGLELGMSAYIPRTPAETMERGFGDCKDKSVLLVSRLRKAGIPAYVALLVPYPAPDVLADVPGLEAFRHAIVYVPGQRPVWLDPSAQFVRPWQLPAGDQGREALVVDKRTTHLLRTPESQAGDNGVSEEDEITLRDGADARLKRYSLFLGAQAEYMRALFANDTLRNLLRNRAAAELKARGDVQFSSSAPDDVEHVFSSMLMVEGYGYAGSQDGVLFADISPVGGDTGFLAALADAAFPQSGGPVTADRIEDFLLPSAYVSERKTYIHVPPGFHPARLPGLSTIQLGPVTLVRKISEEQDGSVTIVRRVESPKRRYTAAEGRAIALALRKALSAPNVHLEFSRTNR